MSLKSFIPLAYESRSQWQRPVAHGKAGVQTFGPDFSGVVKGNVVSSALSQLLDLDYPSERGAAGQG